VVALEYIFFHNDLPDSDDLKYISLSKQQAHLKVEDTEPIIADDGNARPTIVDGVNMFEKPYQQLETGENFLGSFKKHGRGRPAVNENREQNTTLEDLKQAASRDKKNKC